jgi:hypothetical protein
MPRVLVTALAVALLAIADAGAAVRVDTTAEFHRAVDRIGNRAGLIVLERGRYGMLQVGRRSERARWLTVKAQRGVVVRQVELRGARRVRLVGLRVRPMYGRSGLVLVRWSRQVLIDGLDLRGLRRMARVRVRFSSSVTLRDSDLSRCRVICYRADSSRDLRVLETAFHDCFDCDFLVGVDVHDVAVQRNTFDRALPGRCGIGGRCNHQDLVQMVGGTDWLLERNRFGLVHGGAAQVYLSGQWDTDRVTVRSNVFLRSDPAVPGVVADTGLIVGQPSGWHGLPRHVVIAGNTFLSGDPRTLQGAWVGVANGLILSDGYEQLPLGQRPLLVNNVFAHMSHPELVCPRAWASGYNLYPAATSCSDLDLAGDPMIDETGFPLPSSPLIGRADLSWATPVDFDGRPRDAEPDIGAYEWRDPR